MRASLLASAIASTLWCDLFLAASIQALSPYRSQSLILTSTTQAACTNRGQALVLDFAREFLPDEYDEVRRIFSGRGAYRRYKDLLVRRGALERWYDF